MAGGGGGGGGEGAPAARRMVWKESSKEVVQHWEFQEEEEVTTLREELSLVLSKEEAAAASSRVRTSYYICDSPSFDLHEESTVRPMRHAEALAPMLVSSVNVESVRVVESDVGYPIHLYGTVLVRDDIDRKCVYLFRRDRDNAQLISSPHETLILTGPSRGIAAMDELFFEIDLKLRSSDDATDTDFSKGMTYYSALTSAYQKVIIEKVSTMMSTLELAYEPVFGAVEATVGINIVKKSYDSNYARVSLDKRITLPDDVEMGTTSLYAKITARTSGNSNDFVLYDSEASGKVISVSDDGFVELWRRVIAVPIRERLFIRTEAWTRDGNERANHWTQTVSFSPELYGGEIAHVSSASYTMKAKVTWSALYIPQVDDWTTPGTT